MSDQQEVYTSRSIVANVIMHLVSKNPKFQQYVPDAITYGTLNSGGHYTPTSSAFSASTATEDTIKTLGDCINKSFTAAAESSYGGSIRFCKMGRAFFKSAHESGCFPFPFESLIFKRAFGAMPDTFNGINVNPQLDINTNDLSAFTFYLKGCRPPMKDGSYVTIGDWDIIDRAHELMQSFYYIGNTNKLFACITHTNNLYINQPLVDHLCDTTADKQQLSEILFNAFNIVFDEFNDIINHQLEGLMEKAKDKLTNTVMVHMVTRRLEDIMTTKYQGTEASLKSVMDQLKEETDLICQTYLIKSIWGNTKLYTYADHITTVFESLKAKTKNGEQEMMKRCLASVSSFQRLGWSVNFDDEILARNRISFAWKKEVNIVPEYYFRNNNEYEILEHARMDKKNTLKVLAIYVCPDGKMLATGNHPNVNQSGVVCMGDLSGHIKITCDNVANNLSLCEQLLHGINYDSPHHRTCEDLFSREGNHKLVASTSSFLKTSSQEFLDSRTTPVVGVIPLSADELAGCEEVEEEEEGNG